jgi:hypothetical protein
MMRVQSDTIRGHRASKKNTITITIRNKKKTESIRSAKVNDGATTQARQHLVDAVVRFDGTEQAKRT